jgi:L-alanine-DL-glutamate epimerase-like enolase superfamily enzyme
MPEETHDVMIAEPRAEVTAQRPTRMKIAKIDAFALRIPFDTEAAPPGLVRSPGVGSLLVRVTTDEGHVGWGEASAFEASPLTRRVIKTLVGPLFSGRDATRIEPLVRSVRRMLPVLGGSRCVSYAISAIEIALWDIAGKAAGLPLHRLLRATGDSVTELPCYASLDPYAGNQAALLATVRQAIDAGFTAVKLHEQELAAVQAARGEAGPDIELIVDPQHAWPLPVATENTRAFAELNLKWLEEPVSPPQDYQGLARLRSAGRVPLAAGENVATLRDFGRLMDLGAVDFVQPSPARIGVAEASRVFPLAAAHDVTVMPHSFYQGPGLLAAIHLTAALGTPGSMIEWRYTDLVSHIYGDAVRPQNGRIQVPQGPGLGVDPDPEVIRAFPYA